MAEITINGVKYTNVPNKKAGTKFAASLTQSNIGASQAVQDYVNSAYFYPLVNAIDINWNGVEVEENSYINTTSDLISYIASKESNIDLSSYATMTYVNDKISEVIGGAPETLDTLKELADALENEASLAYVTEALAGKANVNDVYTKQEVDNLIPAPVDLSNYVSYTQANSYYVAKEDMPDMNDYATTSYVTTELDKKADKSQLPNLSDYALKAETFSTKNYTDGDIITSYWNPSRLVQEYRYGAGGIKSRHLVFPLYAEKNWSGGGSSGSDSIFALTTSQSKYLSLIRSFVFGDNNEAHHNSGNTYPLFSNILIGDNLKSNTHHTTVLGIYNNVGTYDESTIISSFNPNDSNHSLFVIGNGKDEYTRHNAFEIKRGGQIWIADTYNGTPYSLQSRLNSKANANDVYTKTEVDNMIPESADLRNYVSYTAANSYYMTVEGPKQIINSVKTFVGNKLINFRQGKSGDKLGFTLYNYDEKDVGGLEYRPNTINGNPLISLQHYVNTANLGIIEQSYLGFRQTQGNNKYHLLAPIPADVATVETITDKNYKNFFIPLVFKNGSNKVYTDCTGLVDMASLMPDLNDYATNSYVTTELDKKADKTELPDMTNYVTTSSYNALYEEVQHLAYLISYYHPTPDPTPTPTPTFEGYWTYNGMRTDSITISTSDPNMTLSFVSNPTISSGIGTWNFYDMPSSGVTINSSTGEMTINPSLLSEGSVYSSVGYMYQNNGESTEFYITITVTSSTPTKTDPYAYWSFNGTALHDNELVVLPYDTLTQSTYTFYSDPATGWYVGDTLYETPGITIDSSTHNITVDPTSFEHTGKGRVLAEYNEDATYQQGSCAIEFKILAQGADPQFFFADDDVTMSQNSTQAEVQLYDLTGLTEQGYTPTFTIGNTSYVSVAPRQDAPNYIVFTWLAEGETTVTATITDGNNTHNITINVHCQWDRDWTDGHVYTSQNNEVNYEYGIVKSGSNPSLTFTASNGNTQDPMNGDLFEVSIPNDTYNIVSYTSTSSGLTISFDTSAASNASVGDEINMTIIKQQDTTYGYYSKDLRFRICNAGNDPLLWWNNDTFTVTENDVFSQDPITGWLSNQFIDFSTWQPLTPTLSITTSTLEPSSGNEAHLDQDNVLHGDSAGYCSLVATVTDLNNNTHTATATVHVEAAS